MEREFQFKIKGIYADFKDREKGDKDGLVIVAEDGTVYYTKKGTITTFLPYKHSNDDKLLFLDFCEHKYLLTLHKTIQKQDNRPHFYLSFFDKRTLLL